MKKFVLGLLAGLLPLPAMADIAVQVRDAAGGESFGFTPGLFLVGTAGVEEASLFGGSVEQVFTGTFDFEADYGNGFTPLVTYCLEVDQDVRFQPHPDDVTGVTYKMSDLSGHGLSASEQTQLGLLWTHAYADSLTNSVLSAAFQSVIWDLVVDDSLDLLQGDFALNPGDAFTQQVVAAAGPWIDALSQGTWSNPTPLMALNHPSSQDLLTTVPEPATLSLLALGLLRRRR